ncbi:MAG: cobalamin-dependent protein [Candidatus Izimaplasma sp.]|nr:cobalamin-dependent protein [Candidatus Izimaplasma bacterium]
MIEFNETVYRDILNIYNPENKHKDKLNKKSIQDVKYTLEFLKIAYELNKESIYINYMSWLGLLLENLGFPKNSAEHLHESLSIYFKTKDEDVYSFLKNASFKGIKYNRFKYEGKYKEEYKNYLSHILNRNKPKAIKTIMDMKDQDIPIIDIYTSVLQPTMYKVGQLWHENKISVAMEHYATVITQYIMSLFYSTLFSNTHNKGKLISCVVGNELHELGIRMISDIFEQDGWDTTFLGSNIPPAEVLRMVKSIEPRIIALSLTMPEHLSELKTLISDIRKLEVTTNPIIFVGGRPFILDETLYETVNADDYALDIEDFLKKVKQFE